MKSPSRLPAPGPFVRDAPTLLAYALLGCFTFWLYALSPAVTLLRGELGFSYSTLALYQVLLSGGAALAGAGFVWSTRHVQRGALLWGSALATAGGAGIFALGSGVPATLLGAAALGVAGTTLLTEVQAILSDRHGARRERALIEANVGASTSAVLAPLIIGALTVTAGGWRTAFALPALILLVLYLRYRHRPLPARTQQHASDRGAWLPASCWLFAGLTGVSSAVEFCLVYFGPQLLVNLGWSSAIAGAAMSSNLVGILVGRLVGAGLIRRPGRGVALLGVSLALTCTGVVVFWLSDHLALAVLALFVSGVGIANLYPLALSLTFEAADGQEDTANARSQVVLGVLAAAFPFLLGSLADRYGLTNAFALEPALLGLCVVLLWGGLYVRRRSGPGGRLPLRHEEGRRR